MTVKNKLLMGLGAILFMVIVVGGTGIWNMMRSSAWIEAVGASSRGTMQLANAQNALWQLRYGIMEFIRFTDKAARDKIVSDEARWYREIDANLAAFRQAHQGAEEAALLQKLQAVFKQYKDARPRWFQMYGEWQLEEAAEWHSKTLAPTGERTIAALTELIQLQQKNARALEEEAGRQTARLRIVLIALVALTMAVLLLVAYHTVNAISKPLDAALAMANRVASGDLTAAIEVNSHDEFGKLLSALKTMNENLTRMVHDIRGGADSIHSAAEEVATGNANLSQRTEEQASTLEETVSSMEELTSAVRENTRNADSANQLAEEANRVAARGGDAVNTVVATMNDIQESSKKISDIIGVIDGIAFQTNILALNAAVEAARAGDQGRGFAVVASEVRALAQRSADAAKEIKLLIGNSVEKVDSGTRHVENAGNTMREVVAAVEKVTANINRISSASRQQADGIEQVNRAIGQMDQVVQQNAALVEQAAAAAESMQSNAQQLVQSVSVFKLGGATPVGRRQAPVLSRAAPLAPPPPPAPKLAQTARPSVAPPRRDTTLPRSGTVEPKDDDGSWKEF